MSFLRDGSGPSPEGVGVVCLGEALIDMVSLRRGIGLDGAPGFQKAAGGAPANVAVGVARLGVPAAFIGAVGHDPFGTYLIQELKRHRVSTAGVMRVGGRRTALALVSLDPDGERDFLFYGERPAHLGLRLTDRMQAMIRRGSVLHYGSITLIGNPSRHATLAAMSQARRADRFCSYDPNLRPDLWPDVRTARHWIWEGLQRADCVKVSAEELAFLTGQGDVTRGLRALTEAGPRLAVATLGRDGCAFCSSVGEDRIAGFAAKVVDTTGAGDAFVAGMLVGLLEASSGMPRDLPNASALIRVLTFANAAAALSTELRGGIPSLPSRRQVTMFLARHGFRHFSIGE